MLHHVHDAICFEAAQLTLQRFVVDVLTVNRFELNLLEQLHHMIELDLHALMTNVLNVTIELLDRVRVIVAAVAFKLSDVVVIVGGRRIDDVLELVFVPQSALLDVICKVHSLQVLIGLAVQLTVRFEMGLVAAQTTRVVVVVNDNDELLREAQP